MAKAQPVSLAQDLMRQARSEAWKAESGIWPKSQIESLERAIVMLGEARDLLAAQTQPAYPCADLDELRLPGESLMNVWLRVQEECQHEHRDIWGKCYYCGHKVADRA